jgi:molybdopterin synthase catalytic subunit
VATPHRSEAFRASQWIVDELKKKVPIWKRPKFKVDNLRRASQSEAAIV